MTSQQAWLTNHLCLTHTVNKLFRPGLLLLTSLVHEIGIITRRVWMFIVATST